MAQRYARIDVDFLHKNTARKLTDKLGPLAPLVFIALILRAKDGTEPGTFTYSSEAVAWEKLGLDGHLFPFTLDDFFRETGLVKQTSRRRIGVVWNVRLTRYADWQKDSRRYEAAVKKASTRAHSTGDTNGTQPGTHQGTREGQKGGPRSRSRSIPLTPREKSTNPRAKGTSQRQRGTSPRQTGTAPRDKGTNPRAARPPDEPPAYTHRCPHCRTSFRTAQDRDDHIEDLHPDQHDDDIPL